MPEPPRCVAGYFVGEGGGGCSPHYDANDDGEGVVIASSDRCAGPYEWIACGLADDPPPECDCAVE
jgi:hypothetical protein